MLSSEMQSDEVILAFNRVSKFYDEKCALSELSMVLKPGMVVGLLGQNGAGKSTLMRCALGILSPSDGDILTLGESPLTLSSEAKQTIGYVPQQPFGYEGFTIGKALDLHRSLYPDWDVNLERDWLARFELEPKQQVQRLSVGQRQSLALIMAMAYRPKLLLLDEPVASLDPIARRQFMADLFDLALDSGSAVLFSSHITSDLERVASHVALIRKGKLVLFKEIDALREEVRLVKGVTPAKLSSELKVLHANTRGVVVDNYSESITTEISGLAQSDVEILNLEQLFMELHQI